MYNEALCFIHRIVKDKIHGTEANYSHWSHKLVDCERTIGTRRLNVALSRLPWRALILEEVSPNKDCRGIVGE